jgi:hypothetical protein
MAEQAFEHRDADGYRVVCRVGTDHAWGSVEITTPDGRTGNVGLQEPQPLTADLARAIRGKGKDPAGFFRLYNTPVRRTAEAAVREAAGAFAASRRRQEEEDAAYREAATSLECDRCGKEFPKGQATFRPARVGGWKVKLPYCPDCAHFLYAAEDGYGDAPGSVEPADNTPHHKEQDY